jgi:hypothetical protein
MSKTSKMSRTSKTSKTSQTSMTSQTSKTIRTSKTSTHRYTIDLYAKYDIMFFIIRFFRLPKINNCYFIIFEVKGVL